MSDSKRVGMRILVVDDSGDSQRRLQRGFDRESKIFDLVFVSDIVVSASEAHQRLSTHWYHGISYDQRLPDSREGAVHSEHGLALVRGTAAARRMSFASVYTAYPGGNHGHQIGKEQLEYIAKSSTNDGVTPEGYSRKTVPGYTRWFLEALVWEYPRKVLEGSRNCALFDWGPEIDEVILTLTNVSEMPADESVTKLFKLLSGIRVQINEIMSKVLAVFVDSEGKVNPYTPTNIDPVDVEKNILIQWGIIRKSEQFQQLCLALGMMENSSLDEYYVQHSEKLRKLRNSLEHKNKEKVSPEEFRSHYPSIIRMLDVLRFLASIKIVFQPQSFRAGLLSFKDLGVRGHSPATEIFYEFELGPNMDADVVFLQISNSSKIVDASLILECGRDNKFRPILEVVE